MNRAYIALSSLATLMAIVGVLWGTPWARRARSRRSRLDRMLDDWHGEPARPGYPEAPSYPERMATTEAQLTDVGARLYGRQEMETLWNGLRVIEFNLADLHTDVKAVETRMDLGQRRALKAEGRMEEQMRALHVGLLGHVAHDAAVHNTLRASGFTLPDEPRIPIVVTNGDIELNGTLPKPRPAKKRAERISRKDTR